MNIIALYLLLIGIIYGGITILGAAMQIKKDKINTWSISIMIIGALLIIISVICNSILEMNLIYLLISGLILIHAAAINNGLKMYGKIHLKHHAIRLMISLLMILLYLLQ